MSKKLRYAILALCISIFVILAPWLLLFVRGVRYDTSGSKLKETGILAAETEPGGATVFLNSTAKDATPASIRFLEPGDYAVRVHKDGYFEWQKKLTIFSGKVTWVSPNPNKLVLLKLPTEKQNIASGATHFVVLGNKIVYITNDKTVVILSGTGFTETKTIQLPFKATSLVPAPGNTLVLLTSDTETAILNTTTATITNTSTLVSAKSQFAWIDSASIATLQNGSLSVIDPTSENKTIIVKDIVKSFTTSGNQLYYLAQSGEQYALVNATISKPDQAQTLSNAIPPCTVCAIMVTAQRQIFVRSNDTIYRLGNKLEAIAHSVTGYVFNPESNDLLFSAGGELGFFNPDEDKVKLIDRSTSPFISPLLRRDLNYALYFHDGKLIATELDNRDTPNSYTLGVAKNPGSIALSQDANSLFILDDSTLSVLTIR